VELHFERILPYFNYIWIGLGNTLQITLLSLVGALLIACVLVLFRLSKSKLLNVVAMAYVSLFRGIPLLVQLFISYFAVSQITNNVISMNATTAGIVTFSLYTGAYLGESLRGGILGVDKGQTEAAVALGIKYSTMMRSIILPQALKVVLPSIINNAITLLKNSSIISQIGVMDLMRSGHQILTITYLSFEPLIVVAVFYLALVILLTILSRKLELRLNRSEY
jgi:His/Glu/Gln/Arg/opine family amino acid ABC transporter permease subunit